MSRVHQAKEVIKENFDSNWRMIVRDGYDEEDDSNYEVLYQVSTSMYVYMCMYMCVCVCMC